MNYDESLNLILNKMSLGIMPGLARISALLDKMGNPQDSIKIIHIAGTNGKGTVAKTISDNLISAGYKTGLFTSPWITDYREQIQINSQPISKSDFARYVSKYKDNDCSEFEFLTAVMYKYFCDENVDYAVVECGMGGSGDATNVEKNNALSVITSVSLDHTNFLGNTIEEISKEKSGILRKNSNSVVLCDNIYRNIYNEKCENIVFITPSGDFKADNLAVATAALRLLNIDTNGLQLSKLPARQERVDSVLIDGGHNVAAAHALEPIIDNEVALIGMMRDKNIDGYFKIVAPKCKKIILTKPSNPRAADLPYLYSVASKYCDNVVCIDSPLAALQSCKDISLICGSFYLAREVRNFIK